MCSFCDLDADTRDRIISKTKHSYVVKIRTQYDTWEGHDVSEHYMVIPNRHVPHFKELTPEERLDLMEVIAEYESNGFNIYARGVNSPRRSMPHQHTHLIKIHGKRNRFHIFMERPYFLFRG